MTDSKGVSSDGTGDLVRMAVDVLKHEYVVVHRDDFRMYFVRLLAVLLLSGGVTVAAVLGIVYSSTTAMTARKLQQYETRAMEIIANLESTALKIKNSDGSIVITGNVIVRPDPTTSRAASIQVVGAGESVRISANSIAMGETANDPASWDITNLLRLHLHGGMGKVQFWSPQDKGHDKPSKEITWVPEQSPVQSIAK